MSTEQTFGWIGNIMFAVGTLLLSRKNKKGFVANLMGNSSYIIKGVLTIDIAVLALSIIMFVINIYGILLWRTNGS